MGFSVQSLQPRWLSLARGCLGSAAPAEPLLWGQSQEALSPQATAGPPCSCCPLGRHCWQACSLLGSGRVTAGGEGHESLGVSGREAAEGDPCGLGELISTRELVHGRHSPSRRKHKQGRIRCLGLCKTQVHTKQTVSSPLGGQVQGGSSHPQI